MVCVCASRVFSQRRFFCRVHCQFVIVCVSMCRIQLYPNPENQVESCAFCFLGPTFVIQGRISQGGEDRRDGSIDDFGNRMNNRK